LYRNILIAFDFAKRDLKDRYFGTGLGQIWYILSPLITIFIYTVIFSDFMKMKMNIIDNSYAYSIYLVPGLLAWTSFATTFSRLSTSIFAKADLIKKLNVPMFSFYLAILFSETILLCISFLLGIGFLLLVGQPITFGFLWLPIVLGLQFVFVFSLGVIFSLLMPFFKDLREVVPVMIQLWFWMTPIIYVKEMIYSKYPLIIDLNPMYLFIELYQNIFLYGDISKLYGNIFSIIIICLGLFLFAVYLYKKLISEIKDII